MKITILPPDAGQEDEIIIRCAHPDERLLHLIQSLQADKLRLNANTDSGITIIDPKNVYYFEAVDNKVFAYCEKQVYEIRKKLYELEEALINTEFLRISKSTIVDLSKVEHLSAAFNGRLEARLKNGERIIISRQYVPHLKEKLGL